MKFTLLFLIVVFHQLVQFANGLDCFDCYPCDENNSDNIKTCEDEKYKGLPDSGVMSCSYEVGAHDSVRKRCLFLRNDPDNPGGRDRSRECFRSPMNPDKQDCVCFTDNCNRNMNGEGEENMPFFGGATSNKSFGFFGIFFGFIAALSITIRWE